MLKILQIPGAKLSDKAVARVGERVTTVSKELGQAHWLAAIEIRDRFAAGLAASVSMSSSLESELEPEEDVVLAELTRDQVRPPKTGSFSAVVRQDAHGTELLKTPAGLLRIHVARTRRRDQERPGWQGDFNLLAGRCRRTSSGDSSGV